MGLSNGGVGASMQPISVGRFCCSFRSVDRVTEEVRRGGGNCVEVSVTEDGDCDDADSSSDSD